MKKLLPFLFACCPLLAILYSSVNCFAQITFQKNFAFNNIDTHDEGRTVQQTTDNGFIIGGSAAQYPADGNFDFYLVKTYSNGYLNWSKTYGTTNGGEVCNSAQQTTDGGYVMIGYRYTNSDQNDMYVVKTDANGNLLWSKTYGTTANENAYCGKQTTDGGYIICGTYSLDSSMTEVYLLKADSIGNLLWTKTFDSGWNDEGYSVQQTTDGGFIIVGQTYAGAGNGDVYLLKTDGNGNLLWSKTYGTTAYQRGYVVQQTSDGGFVIAGSFWENDNDIYIIKTDSSGNMLWSKKYAGLLHEEATSVQQIIDGCFIIAGTRQNWSLRQGVLLKTDTNGNLLWTQFFGGGIFSRFNCVQQTIDGGYVMCGESQHTPNHYEDVYLVKTDSMGNVGCYQYSNALSMTIPSTIVTTPIIQVSSIGFVANPSTLVDSGGVDTVLCFSDVGIDENNSKQESILIYPNPTSGLFNVQMSGLENVQMKDIEVINVLGEQIQKLAIGSKQLATNSPTIDLSSQPEGIYFVRVDTEKGIVSKKVVVMR